MMSLSRSIIVVFSLLLAISATGIAAKSAIATDTSAVASDVTNVGDQSTATAAKPTTLVAAETQPEEEDAEGAPAQYPFRDLPADVLRDFPGLCFGSTALRLFQVGQSWSLSPFCGVATCLVSNDGFHLVERVQDCGPQPKRNARCSNVNAKSEAAFPSCCPTFVCEEGVELEYPSQEELQQLAHEAAQAAVRAQYDEVNASGAAGGTARSAGALDQQAEDLDAAVPEELVAEDPIVAA